MGFGKNAAHLKPFGSDHATDLVPPELGNVLLLMHFLFAESGQGCDLQDFLTSANQLQPEVDVLLIHHCTMTGLNQNFGCMMSVSVSVRLMAHCCLACGVGASQNQ
jgi:hypothetical protein